MSRVLNPKQLEIAIKRETDLKRKQQLEKELKFAERERDKRLKDFKKAVSAPNVNVAALEKMAAREPDPTTARKMKSELAQLKKTILKADRSPRTSPATPKVVGLTKVQEKREAKKRLDKFEVMAKKAPGDIKMLTKVMKAETDVPTKKAMMQTIKKLETDLKKQKAAATSSSSSSSSSGSMRSVGKTATGAKGPSQVEINATKDRLKKFETGVMREKRDLKKFEKEIQREKDPKVKSRMTQILKKAQAKLKR